ncbi:MAG TPA: Pyrrolo-quinoline quinone, partial [Lentisphaeria bacterium]|nr:Pyrrolo-quinoline quinone [Lentisphaeria bacterium]
MCLLLGTACSGSAGDSWPMFHGEPQLRGVSSSRLAPAYELAWRFETGDAVKSSPVVANGVVCFGSLDTFVYAVSLAAGEKIWSFETAGGVASTPLLHNGRVFVGSGDARLYAFDMKDGKELWHYTCNDRIEGGINRLIHPTG